MHVVRTGTAQVMERFTTTTEAQAMAWRVFNEAIIRLAGSYAISPDALNEIAGTYTELAIETLIDKEAA